MAQLEVRTRAQITKYYETPYVCDDTTCDCVTYGLGVYGKKCLKRDCYGGMLIKRDFNDKMLYTQLSYFQSLFDYEKNKKQLLKVYEMTLEKGEKNPYICYRLTPNIIFIFHTQNMRLAVFFDYFFFVVVICLCQRLFSYDQEKKREGPTDDYESLSYYELNFQFFFFIFFF